MWGDLYLLLSILHQKLIGIVVIVFLIQVENSIKPNRLPGDGINNIAVSEYDIFPYSGLNRDVCVFTLYHLITT